MQQNFCGRKAYHLGEEYLKKGNQYVAKSYFELASKDPSYYWAAMTRLIRINLSFSNYVWVRSQLENIIKNQEVNNQSMQNHPLSFIKLYGLLESIEYNYLTSKNYYNMCMDDVSLQNAVLLDLVKINMQLGDYELARLMLETLRLNPNYYYAATYRLICLYIIEGDLKAAANLLDKVKISKVNGVFNKYFMKLKSELAYLQNPKSNFQMAGDYDFFKLINKNAESNLEHIAKHKDVSLKASCYFLEYIDIKKLHDEVYDKIQNMNPNFNGTNDVYALHLDTPIGFANGELTNDIEVITVIGTKNIVTIYPVLLSKEFDKEGISHSKELMLKRKQGRK